MVKVSAEDASAHSGVSGMISLWRRRRYRQERQRTGQDRSWGSLRELLDGEKQYRSWWM